MIALHKDHFYFKNNEFLFAIQSHDEIKSAMPSGR